MMRQYKLIKPALWGIISMIAIPGYQSDLKSQVTITAHADVDLSSLVVTYRILNRSNGPIVVWDRMIDYDEKGEKLDNDGAYVFLDKIGVVRLVRAQLRLPPNVQVFKKEIPYVRVISPLNSADGLIRLSLPLREFSPFFPPPSTWHQMKCTHVRLLVGWMEVEPDMKISSRMLRGVEVSTVKGRWPAPYQHLLDVTLDIPIDLLTRTDDFDRSMPMN